MGGRADLKLLTAQLEVRKALKPLRESSDGVVGEAWGDRDGSLVVKPLKMAYVDEGRCFHFDIGAFSTPIVGGGNGDVIDQNQPEGILSVPTGVAIKLLRVSAQVEVADAIANHDDVEILLAADVAAAWPLDGTVTTETPVNMRTDSPRGSMCNCASACTADLTNPTLGMELDRKSVSVELAANGVDIVTEAALLYEPETPATIVGPAAVYLYWGGTQAHSGFGQIEYAEFSEDEVT